MEIYASFEMFTQGPIRVVDKLVQLCFVCLVRHRQPARNAALFIAHLPTKPALTSGFFFFDSVCSLYIICLDRHIRAFIGPDLSNHHAARCCVKHLQAPQLSAIEDWYVSPSPTSVLS